MQNFPVTREGNEADCLDPLLEEVSMKWINITFIMVSATPHLQVLQTWKESVRIKVLPTTTNCSQIAHTQFETVGESLWENPLYLE